MANIALRPSYWANVSGGKDSLYMLKLILSKPDKYPLSGVVHFELEIDYPFIANVIDYMESECNRVGIPFIRIKPRNSWYNLYDKYGFPTRRARWCNSAYKLDAERQVREFLKKQGWNMISYIGYCVDEEARYQKRTLKPERYPLVEEGVCESDILEWAKTVPVFNDYYKYNRRCGCMYCPMASRKELAYLLKYYPEKYDFLMKCASETEAQRMKEYGIPFSVWGSNPKYNTQWVDRSVREKYLPMLNQEEGKTNEENLVCMD